MRLLHTSALTFSEYFDDSIPPYAVLSHRWSSAEVSFHDFDFSKERNGADFQKIAKCCALAKHRGQEWVWIDTCCIDKSSSAEITEAINSMWNWYLDSRECYVCLNDLEAGAEVREFEAIGNWGEEEKQMFQASKWFKRGWTLQELIAPAFVLFYDSRWRLLGIKGDVRGDYFSHAATARTSPYIGIHDLSGDICAATGIEHQRYLHSQYLEDANIATKMSWVSGRATSRKEDIAYCLLGIFNVNMPLLYGEGDRAFRRLQLEIIKEDDDESIFAWTSEDYSSPRSEMLAPHPIAFKNSTDLHSIPGIPPRPTWSMTNRGIAIHVMESSFQGRGDVHSSIRYLKRSSIKLTLDCGRKVDGVWKAVELSLLTHDNKQWFPVHQDELELCDIDPLDMGYDWTRSKLIHVRA